MNNEEERKQFYKKLEYEQKQNIANGYGDDGDEGKFACVEDFAKEVAYRKYLASKEEKKEMSKKEQKLSFGLSNNKTEPSTSKKNVLIDKLAKI